MGSAVAGDGRLHAGNHRLKRLRRLLSSRKARSDERAFVVEGPIMVAEALAAGAARGLRVEGLYAEPGVDPAVVELAEALGVAVYPVAPGVLASALDTVNPQPVALIASREPAALVELGTTGTVLCLVEPRDPGNVGTLIRSAEASGAAGVVLAGPSVDPTNPKALRASAGAGLRLPVVVVADAGAALSELAATSRLLVATVVGPDAVPYDQVPLADAVVILGNEAHGLPAAVVAMADVAATIPLAGPTESLNVAAAGAVLCFEALRQRRSAAGPGRASPGGRH